MDPSNQQTNILNQEPVLDQSAAMPMQMPINNFNSDQPLDINAQNNEFNTLTNQMQAPLPQLPPPRISAPQQQHSQSSLNGNAMAPIVDLQSQSQQQQQKSSISIQGEKLGWDTAVVGQQQTQLNVQQDEELPNQHVYNLEKQVEQQVSEPKQCDAYLAQQKQLTVGIIAPYAQQQQQQLDEQAIEKRLIEQDNQSQLDSNTTSNLNLDSGTIRDKDGMLQKQIMQNDPFQNFDYDKNQSKFQDDEKYPDPPSFLLKVNDKTKQESQDHNMQTQEVLQQQIDVGTALQPVNQESSIIEESEQRVASNSRQNQGLHQPYEPTVYYDFKDFPDMKWEPFKDQVTCPPNSFFDARNFENNGDKMENLLKGGTNKPILFDLQNTWLKGEQYAHILQNQDRYCQTFGIKKYDYKQHPESIYIDPKDGLLYFVQGESIGSDFGFPRLGIRKRFKWKKMNFTTDLPKRDPLVSYIVASAVKCEKFFPGSNDDGPVYRMHAVILKKRDMTLQLPSKGGSDLPSAKKIDTQLSQETNNQNDKQSTDQQPRSKHGRVLTKSTKLKAAQITSTASVKKSNSQSNQGGTQQYNFKDDAPHKNYILCHVRRVMGKRDEEFDSDGNEDSPLKKECSQAHLDSQKQQCSKIPNKGKNKFDQIPLQFSEDVDSPGKDKKIPNLKMFQGMSLDQIKKMKVGPDGKPLSIYKIKKYILPYNKIQTDNMSQQQPQQQQQYKSKDDIMKKQNVETNNLSDNQSSLEEDSPMEPQQSKSIQIRNRKRPNNQPVEELENQINQQSGNQMKPNKIQNIAQNEQILEDQKNELKQSHNNNQYEKEQKVVKNETLNNKKQISVEMIDEGKSNKIESVNNNVKQVDDKKKSEQQNQLNQLIDQNQQQSDNQNLNSSANNQLNNLNNQGQINFNNIDQVLKLNLLNNGNNFGLNNLGLQNSFGGVNGLMLNQLNLSALQNFNAQQNNLSQLLGANPNNLGLNNDLAFQNQLLGLQNNLGLNNFGGLYGLNNINNNLLNMNQLQNINLNGFLGPNPLNNFNAIQLQQNLLKQNVNNNNPLVSSLQDQLKLSNQLNFDNSLQLMNLQNNGIVNANGNTNENGLNIGDLFNASIMSKSKDNNKSSKKVDPMKQFEQLKNTALSPNLLQKDSYNGVSPQLKKNNINSAALMGLGNVFQNTGSNNQGVQKRKQTLDNMNLDWEDLTNDLLMQCQHEIQTRRLSGVNFGPNDQKSNNMSPKSNNLSNFSKSPNIQPATLKLADQLNKQLGPNFNNRKKSMVSHFGRDRLNSNMSAFKKFNHRNQKDKDITHSPLIEGKQGEPSFGPDSIHDSKSIANLRPPKNSEQGPSMQNISKKSDSNSLGQNNLKGQKQQNQLGVNSLFDQSLQLQYMQLLNQFPGASLEQLQLNNLNPKLPTSGQQNATNTNGNNNSTSQFNATGTDNFNQSLQNAISRGNNFNLMNENAANLGQQMKGNNQPQNQQQMLLQQQQFQQLLYHLQSTQMIHNQLLNQQLGMNNPNFDPLGFLNQPNLLQNNPNNQNQSEKIDQKQMITKGQQSAEQQLKNQHLNVFQNTHLQPAFNSVIVNQFGSQNVDYDQIGGMQNSQNRKDSIRGGLKSTQTHSPNIQGGRINVRARGDSLKQKQLFNDLHKALAPNPANCGAQPQDQSFGGNNLNNNGSMIIAPSKQHSHRNSNISQQQILGSGHRKSTDIVPVNKHKFSITQTVIKSNPPTFPLQQFNQNNMKLNQQSQQSNNSNKLQSSHQISQDNQQMTSPDRHLDSSLSQKQESLIKIHQQNSQINELMKSPGILPDSGRTNLTSRRKQSNGIDIMSKFNQAQQPQIFMQPVARNSGQLQQFAQPTGQPMGLVGEPSSGARISDEAAKRQANNKTI